MSLIERRGVWKSTKKLFGVGNQKNDAAASNSIDLNPQVLGDVPMLNVVQPGDEPGVVDATGNGGAEAAVADVVPEGGITQDIPDMTATMPPGMIAQGPPAQFRTAP